MSNLMPPGWSAHQDPNGRWYYAHVSGTTQWHPPQPQHMAHQPPPPPPSHYPHHNSSYPHQQHPGGQYAGQASVQHHASAGVQPGLSHSVSAGAKRYVFHHPVELKLQEKVFSLSGDAFSIKNVVTKEPMFKVTGNALSFKDSKALKDLNGSPIYKMSEVILSLRGRMHITDPGTKQIVLTLRKKGFITGFGAGTVQAWRGGTDEGEPYLECKGNFLKKDFDIRDLTSGRVIASIKRKSFSVQNILFEKDTYVIRIESGVDVALMVMFVIAVDEQYRDDGTRKGYGSFF